MKRQLFITAVGAAALAGCGGHGMVPRLGSSGGSGATTHAPTGPFTLIPAVPDPIPANVLAHPILGEARRFVGATPPDGWLFMNDQALRVDQYPSLFAMLGHPSPDKTQNTFVLPNPGYSIVVAAAGAIPTSPQALASMRDLTLQTSLGPSAMPAPTKPKPESKASQEARALAALAVGPRGGSPEELSPDASAAMDRARLGAYGDAANAISPRAAVLVRDAVAAAVDGRTTVYGAVTQVAGQIGLQDAWAALAVNDRMQRAYSASPSGHQDPQREAAQFLVSNAITPDQASAIADREQ